MIYGGGFSLIKFRGSVTPPHQAACGVLVKVIVMISSGGEFSYNKISKFCYPASSSGAEYSLQYFSVHITAPHQAAYGVLVKVLF